MDAQGGRAPRRSKRARKLVLAVLQNLLVVACLLLTLSIYWRSPEDSYSEDFVHIRFSPIADITRLGLVRFKDVDSKHLMNLIGDHDEISISCTGPYVLYMDACCISLNGGVSSGSLQLQVTGQKTAASSFTLNATSEMECRGLHSTVYLRAGEQASLNLSHSGSLKVKTVSVALSYLGGQCAF